MYALIIYIQSVYVQSWLDLGHNIYKLPLALDPITYVSYIIRVYMTIMFMVRQLFVI